MTKGNLLLDNFGVIRLGSVSMRTDFRARKRVAELWDIEKCPIYSGDGITLGMDLVNCSS